MLCRNKAWISVGVLTAAVGYFVDKHVGYHSTKKAISEARGDALRAMCRELKYYYYYKPELVYNFVCNTFATTTWRNQSEVPAGIGGRLSASRHGTQATTNAHALAFVLDESDVSKRVHDEIQLRYNIHRKNPALPCALSDQNWPDLKDVTTGKVVHPWSDDRRLYVQDNALWMNFTTTYWAAAVQPYKIDDGWHETQDEEEVIYSRCMDAATVFMDTVVESLGWRLTLPWTKWLLRSDSTIRGLCAHVAMPQPLKCGDYKRQLRQLFVKNYAIALCGERLMFMWYGPLDVYLANCGDKARVSNVKKLLDATGVVFPVIMHMLNDADEYPGAFVDTSDIVVHLRPDVLLLTEEGSALWSGHRTKPQTGFSWQRISKARAWGWDELATTAFI